MYQQVNLANHALVGTPGTLPLNLVGLSDSVVADISAAVSPAPPGMAGQGWWPVTLVTPGYDATAQIPDGTYGYAANVGAKTVTGTASLRSLTSGELAAKLAAAKARLTGDINTMRGALIDGGYAHDFGGQIGIKVLQTADQDKLNWTQSGVAYNAAIIAGASAVLGAVFRFQDNTMTTLSYADGIAVLLAMSAWGAAIYRYSWGLKDSIAAASTIAAVNAIDITAGWPS